MITYSCDDAGLYASLRLLPAADHKPGETFEIIPHNKTGKQERKTIPQVPHTYKVVGLMNEHQLAIPETTFGGREGLANPQGLFIATR